jgi:hypothetical protein
MPLGIPRGAGARGRPEGSLLIFPLLMAMAFGMWLWSGRTRRIDKIQTTSHDVIP